MNALELIRALTIVTFDAVFAVVLVQAIRAPRRSTFDIALFFAAPAIVLTESIAFQAAGVTAPALVSTLTLVLLLAIPVLTLRAIEGLATLARGAIPLAVAGWLLSSVLLAGAGSTLPQPLVFGVVVYFVAFEGYAGFAILAATRSARGVSRRRLQLIAAGTVSFGLAILAAGLGVAVPAVAQAALPLVLVSGLAYLVGFAPPAILRGSWQAPGVYRFIRTATRVAGERDRDLVLSALARDCADVLGTASAGIGLWDAEREVFKYWTSRGDTIDRRLDETMAAEAFTQQRPIIADEATSGRTIPARYRLHRRHQVLAAPITVGEHRFGVISTIAERSSLFFFEDDLALLALIADQIAVVLENRRLFEVIDGLNATLEERLIELRVVNKELSAFAYSVSHDLRAPLRSIDGFSQILQEDHAENLGEEGRRVLGRVRAGAVQLGLLIDDLLALSRVTRDEMRVADVDLGQIAEGIVGELRQRDPGRAMEFSAVRSPIARGDPRLLKVALTNLLENAWKFTRGRAPAHVTFAGEEKDGEVVFQISDDGAGFDMRYADKLFGAFQRLHSQAEFEGTGIGLATVQRIMHRHGGRIWASAEPGKGATFFFSLPLAQGAVRTEV